MKNKLEKNWPSIRLTIINWLIFCFLSLIVTSFLLMREIKSLRQDKAELTNDMVRMRHNLELIEEQMGSGKVILELGGGME
jgi:hypothetical protein